MIHIPREGICVHPDNCEAVKKLLDREINSGQRLLIKVEPWHEKRTLNQNAMFHAWMGELSRFLINRGRPFCSPEWCKDAMKFTFLGFEEICYTDVKTGAQIVKETLRQTSKLRTGEMFQFMTQVEAWCLNIGCFLRVPTTSEFFALKRKQEE
ncbi:hypothetical protein F3J37_01345 [Pantoea sp. Al-1710]|uniref:NinB protein n=1 Tax=Candidatus Pantoea communis TaxID=2608354 RepID=A0ABX0RJ04_9GAMM|nr:MULTISPECIES: recombination protein NinB [Pantoea]NIG12977.1 hypothetical protein [Pantoea sp. Cy-640]NIG17322.1 hypothetical protein [Pantoea communis]